jgi:hypothetical protein
VLPFLSNVRLFTNQFPPSAILTIAPGGGLSGNFKVKDPEVVSDIT